MTNEALETAKTLFRLAVFWIEKGGTETALARAVEGVKVLKAEVQRQVMEVPQ